MSLYLKMNYEQDACPSTCLLQHLGDKDAQRCDTRTRAWLPKFSELEFIEEVKKLYAIALPMVITGLLLYGKSCISMLFMGRLGKEALAGGALAIGFANITGYSVISGLSMGMEAISSQACGAKQWPLMGQTLQRTIVILLFVCIPISLLWLTVQPILRLCGQDPYISSMASTYLAYLVPDLLFQSFINPIRIYLRTQNITLPLMFSAAYALLFHALVNSFFFYGLKLGIKGIALAVVITDLNLLACTLLYLLFSGVCKKSWQGWSSGCFSEWKPILCLAIPNCVSVCLEWWWYELMIILSGLLPNAAIAISTTGVVMQATSLVYIFPSSLSQAISTLVGNELGANRPGKAKVASRISLSCAILVSFVATLFMVIMRKSWGQLFTQDAAILSMTAMVMPVVGLCELGNSAQTTLCGVLRGSARPSLGANINLVSFYGVGLPVAILLSFVMEMGFMGLWLGLLAAQIVCAIVMVLVLMRTDWDRQASRAQELTGLEKESIQGLESVEIVN